MLLKMQRQTACNSVLFRFSFGQRAGLQGVSLKQHTMVIQDMCMCDWHVLLNVIIGHIFAIYNVGYSTC